MVSSNRIVQQRRILASVADALHLDEDEIEALNEAVAKLPDTATGLDVLNAATARLGECHQETFCAPIPDEWAPRVRN